MEEREYIEEIIAIKKELLEEQGSKTTSETIGALAGALAKAQGKIKKALKNSENPFLNSDYADLGSVLDACKEALSENELAVFQTTVERVPPFVCIETLLAHSSGEWIKSSLTMQSIQRKKDGTIVERSDPQGVGSTITYARRYALAAMVGVAPEGDDDDGNLGDDGDKKKGKGKGKKKEDSVKPGAKDKGKPEPKDEGEDVKLALKRELGELCFNDKEVMLRVLKDCSKFKGKDKKEKFIDGSAGIEEASVAWCGTTLAEVRKRLKDRADHGE